MYSLIRKSVVLVSILTLLPLASASAERKKVPLILMDRGDVYVHRPRTIQTRLLRIWRVTGVSTHLGKIVSDWGIQ